MPLSTDWMHKLSESDTIQLSMVKDADALCEKCQHSDVALCAGTRRIVNLEASNLYNRLTISTIECARAALEARRNKQQELLRRAGVSLEALNNYRIVAPENFHVAKNAAGYISINRMRLPNYAYVDKDSFTNLLWLVSAATYYGISIRMHTYSIWEDAFGDAGDDKWSCLEDVDILCLTKFDSGSISRSTVRKMVELIHRRAAHHKPTILHLSSGENAQYRSSEERGLIEQCLENRLASVLLDATRQKDASK